MNIAIEARALSSNQTGVRRYVEGLITHLHRVKGVHSFVIINSSPSARYYGNNISTVRLPLRSDAFLPFWLHSRVPKYLKRERPDIAHFTKGDVPKKKVCPYVVTVYDIMPLLLPETQTVSRRWYWRGALRRAILTSDHIITVSKSSKKDIISMFGIPDDKITVTYPAVDTNVFKPILNQGHIERILHKHNVPRPYILFVGTRDARKNIQSILFSLQSLRNVISHTLVIVGKKAHRDDNTDRLIDTLNLRKRVIVRDDISNRDLPYLYNGADVHILPSVYEGWGFPAQEAMACGTPTIVSDGGSLPEVVGDSGEVVKYKEHTLSKRYEDTTFTTRLTNTLVKILNNHRKRRDKSIKGLTRIRNHSWDEVASQTVRIYEEVRKIHAI